MRLFYIVILALGLTHGVKALDPNPQYGHQYLTVVHVVQDHNFLLSPSSDMANVEYVYDLESLEEDDDHELDDIIGLFNRLHWVNCLHSLHYSNTFYFIKIGLYNYLVLRRLLI